MKLGLQEGEMIF